MTTNHMQVVDELAQRIANFAGTFKLSSLERAAISLCLLMETLIEKGSFDGAPVRVHVNAMRLFSAAQTPMSDEHSSVILGELAKVRLHYADLAAGAL